MNPGELLGAWLAKRLPLDAADWLAAVAGLVQAAPTDRPLYLAIGEVSRRVARQPLAPTDAELAAAAASRPGWDPRDWTLDQAARVRLLLASTADGALLSRRLDTLCSAADVGELVAFYRGLPLYPDPTRHVLRAAEGVRSNMRVVFEAVAHRNPYPAEHFVESAWNQMVLKALFVGTRLDLIAGLDRRANPALARMLCDYAHERWAASRPVSPELWRCVGPFATGAVLDDFRRLLERGTGTEKQAAALALVTAEDAGAKALLDSYPALAEAARGGRLDWESLATAGT
jgi:hypothetical protein